MISKTFSAGNYNDLDNFAKQTLPNALHIIRYIVIPKIDDILDSMLGARADIKKKSIDTTTLCSNNKITTIHCEAIYNVDDFNVPTAPVKAIKNDTDAIKNNLNLKEIELKSVSIDTHTGDVKFIFDVPLEK